MKLLGLDLGGCSAIHHCLVLHVHHLLRTHSLRLELVHVHQIFIHLYLIIINWVAANFIGVIICIILLVWLRILKDLHSLRIVGATHLLALMVDSPIVIVVRHLLL